VIKCFSISREYCGCPVVSHCKDQSTLKYSVSKYIFKNYSFGINICSEVKSVVFAAFNNSKDVMKCVITHKEHIFKYRLSNKSHD
jgi:hypothetical protein